MNGLPGLSRRLALLFALAAAITCGGAATAWGQIRVIPGIPIVPGVDGATAIERAPVIDPAYPVAPATLPGRVPARLTLRGFVVGLRHLAVADVDALRDPDAPPSAVGPGEVAVRSRTLLGVVLKVGGEFPLVYLGDVDYLDDHGVRLGIGNRIAVTGLLTRARTGGPILIGDTLYFRDAQLPLRDESGLWLAGDGVVNPPDAVVPVRPAVPVDPAAPRGPVVPAVPAQPPNNPIR